MIQNRLARVIMGGIAFLLSVIVDLIWDLQSYRVYVYAVPYLISGHYVLYQAAQNILKGRVFDEFSLMSLATIGAFVIGEYPEGVFVMLFYELGEYAQSKAVGKAKRQIDSLLDQRPEKAQLKSNGHWVEIPASEVEKGSVILVKKGESVPIDGTLLDEQAHFNTASITGESIPKTLEKGETVLSGYINEGSAVKLETTEKFENSAFSRIVELTRKASKNKAPTETFLRKITKIYTPLVAVIALGLFLLPSLFVQDYVWEDWLYRACVFLVISCPCALVLSIPLTYFAGIGAAGRNGILTKGANFLEQLTRIKGMIFDKTGTLTKGTLEVKEVRSENVTHEQWRLIKTLTARSSHPVSKAVHTQLEEYREMPDVGNIEEKPGKGMYAVYDGKIIRIGSPAWIGEEIEQNPEYSPVVVEYDHKVICTFLLKDELKEDAVQVIDYLHRKDLKTYLLSGDQDKIVDSYASQLGIRNVRSEMDPEQKLEAYNEWKSQLGAPLAFVGDGINDSAVMVASDLGIAMGKTGSDIAIEAADVVIPGDVLAHIPEALQIARKTQMIVWQNISLVFAIKFLVLGLGAAGFISLWMAIIADVGIALVAVLNAARLGYFKASWSPS